MSDGFLNSTDPSMVNWRNIKCRDNGDGTASLAVYDYFPDEQMPMSSFVASDSAAHTVSGSEFFGIIVSTALIGGTIAVYDGANTQGVLLAIYPANPVGSFALPMHLGSSSGQFTIKASGIGVTYTALYR